VQDKAVGGPALPSENFQVANSGEPRLGREQRVGTAANSWATSTGVWSGQLDSNQRPAVPKTDNCNFPEFPLIAGVENNQ